MKRRAAVVLFAALAAISLSLAPASATGRQHRDHGKVLVVDNQHRHWSCLGTRKPFQTIQGAVDVARPGATIFVCPGLYEETVKVWKPRLTLKGANAGRDATSERRGRESVVRHLDLEGTVQLLEDDITWDGFTILGTPNVPNGPTIPNGPGMRTDPDHSGYLIRDTIFQDNGIGLRLAANGHRPSVVCRNRFVANNEFDPTGGYGIVSNQPTRRVEITSNRFEAHNGGAILFSDSGAETTHTDVLIDHNKSVDDLTFATIFSSTRLRLSSNDARSRLDGPAEGASSIYVGARNRDIVVHRNRVRSASGNGIDVTAKGEGGKLPLAAPVNVRVTRNKASGALLAGLHMDAGAEDVTVTGNTALDNGEWDCRDRSSGSGTAGTANTWTANFGVRSTPGGLCAPPPPLADKPGYGKGHHHHKKKHKKRQDPCACTRYHPRAV